MHRFRGVLSRPRDEPGRGAHQADGRADGSGPEAAMANIEPPGGGAHDTWSVRADRGARRPPRARAEPSLTAAGAGVVTVRQPPGCQPHNPVGPMAIRARTGAPP